MAPMRMIQNLPVENHCTYLDLTFLPSQGGLNFCWDPSAFLDFISLTDISRREHGIFRFLLRKMIKNGSSHELPTSIMRVIFTISVVLQIKNFNVNWRTARNFKCFIRLEAARFPFQEVIFRIEGFKPFGFYLTLVQFALYYCLAATELFIRGTPSKRAQWVLHPFFAPRLEKRKLPCVWFIFIDPQCHFWLFTASSLSLLMDFSLSKNAEGPLKTNSTQ